LQLIDKFSAKWICWYIISLRVYFDISY